ncbi:MAG TPA: His/Gly/Thr/Pro-type tRNA ligase C-terminal domain-containing protein, partial [Erysipelothrix sp.]|nr:His/Gly/Thr/Pro-type tRNA ligase C-terminal domain-containing protein [Erysipelothrix sp.]
REQLVSHFEPYIDDLGEDNKRRYKQNPLRILDDKFYQDHEALISAPTNRDALNDESKTYFETVCSVLDTLGVAYEINPKLVRGLDYYHHTVFEVVSTDPNVGAQSTIFAGGRYDHLVSYYGGPEISAFGFGMGIERLMVFLEMADLLGDEADYLDVFVMPLDKNANSQALKVSQILRDAGYVVDLDFNNRSMRAQFKMVDRYKAKVAVLIGDTELNEKRVTLKNIITQEQSSVTLDEMVETINQWIGV